MPASRRGPPGTTRVRPLFYVRAASRGPGSFREDFVALTQVRSHRQGSLGRGFHPLLEPGDFCVWTGAQTRAGAVHPVLRMCTRWGRQEDLRRAPGGPASLGSKAWPSGTTGHGASGRTRRGVSSSRGAPSLTSTLACRIVAGGGEQNRITSPNLCLVGGETTLRPPDPRCWNVQARQRPAPVKPEPRPQQTRP